MVTIVLQAKGLQKLRWCADAAVIMPEVVALAQYLLSSISASRRAVLPRTFGLQPLLHREHAAAMLWRLLPHPGALLAVARLIVL